MWSITSYVTLLIINVSLGYILDGDGPKCIQYEDVTEAAVEVKVEEDIEVVAFNKKLADITRVKYGQHLKLICDIQLSAPMAIRWRGRHRALNGKPSAGNKEMDVIANIELHGEYITCEASLVSNPNVNKTFGTNIAISDLARPKISDLTANKITVRENNKLTLSCKVIRGIPQPTVHWQMKKFGDNEYRDLHVTDEELVVDNATFANVGQYRCIAVNPRGHATKKTEVVVEKVPVAAIEEGSAKTFPYGNTTVFTCRVQGYPLPTTVWRSNNGNEVYSEETMISWHEKVSRIKLQNMKKSNNYTCFAQNTLGKVETGVNVTILSPFVVHRHPENTTNVHYEEKTSIVCDIRSSFPMTIKWFHRSSSSSVSTEIHTDSTYNVDSNDTVLTIMAPNLTSVGNYTCEAALVSDKDEKISFTTDLQIDDLAPPSLNSTNKVILMEKNSLSVYCNIAGGVPLPTRNWQVKRHGDSEYKDLHLTNEEFNLEDITISDSGNYRCIVSNAIGKSVQSTELLVRKEPVVIIKEPAVSVMYGSDYIFSCRVVGYPLPNITWNDTKGVLIPSQVYTVHEHELISRITVEGIKAMNKFSCYANNSLGKDESSIDVTVLSPFIVHQHPDNITNVHYLASANLVCNITSSLPMTIKWFQNSTEIHTSDKFTISTNKTVLTINSMDLDLLGHYRCEASLLSDENEKKEFSSDVLIDDLQPPVITSHAGNSVTVKNFEELSLACKATGHPTPVMTWTAQTTGSPSFKAIGTGDSICSTNLGYVQAGTYKCTATNIVGEDSWTTYVTVA